MLQMPQLDPMLLGLLLAVALSATAVVSMITWVRRARNRQVQMLDGMLLSKTTIPVADLANQLDRRALDRSSTLGVIRRSKNAILSVTGATVVSAPLLAQRLRLLLHDSSAVHVADECKRWGLTDAQICSVVETVCKAEGMDVVRTRDGDFILIPDLKERMRDLLSLNGRLDIRSEAQRMKVDAVELRRLVQTWGWQLVESSDDSLVSSPWLKSTLERGVEKLGYLDPRAESARLLIPVDSIMEAVKELGWALVETQDGRHVPAYLLEQHLVEKMEQEGYVRLEAEAKQLRVALPHLLKLLRTAGLRIVTAKDHSVMTIDHVRELVRDDLQLSGLLSPEQEAEALGIDTRIIEDILRVLPGLRKNRDGRYISLESFGRWLLQEAEENGVIHAGAAGLQWGLSPLELQVGIKQSGLDTVSARSGDYVSVAFVRRKLLSDLGKGIPVEASAFARELGIETATAEGIMRNLGSEGLVTGDGSLIPLSLLKKELQQALASTGIINPAREAAGRKLDVSDVRRVLRDMGIQTMETVSGKLVDISWMVNGMRQAVKMKGLFDLTTFANRFELDYATVADMLEKKLEADEIIIDHAGVIVSSKWIDALREYASSKDIINVTQFADERNLRREAALHLLRTYIGGLYNSKKDSFTPRLRHDVS